jgi:hypothetical protein
MLIPVRDYIGLPKTQELLAKCVDGTTPALQEALLNGAPLMGNFKTPGDVSISLLLASLQPPEPSGGMEISIRDELHSISSSSHGASKIYYPWLDHWDWANPSLIFRSIPIVYHILLSFW